MKKKKGIVLIIICIFLGTMCLFNYFFDYLEIYKKIIGNLDKEKDYYGVVDQFDINYESVSGIYNDKFVVSKNNKYGVVDKDNNILIDLKYDKFNIPGIIGTNKKYFELRSGNLSTYFDENMNVILENIEGDVQFYGDIYNSNLYYLNNEKLYDSSNKPIHVFKDFYYLNIIDGYVNTDDNVLYSIKDDKILPNSQFITLYNNYALLKIEDTYKLYDIKNKKIDEYDSYMEYDNYYLLSNSDTTTYLSIHGEILDSSLMYKINDTYYANYGICDYSAGISDKNGNKLIDKCYDYYDSYIIGKDKLVLIGYNEGIGFEDVYVNGELKYEGVALYGDLIVKNIYYDDDSGSETYYYDLLTGDKLDDICNGSFEQNGEFYICNNEILLDSDYNTLYKFDRIFSSYNNNGLMLIKQNDKYGLLLDGKIFVDPVYKDVEIKNDYVIFTDLFGCKVLKFNNVEDKKLLLNKDDLVFDFYNPYNSADIDLDFVIDKYSLNDMKDIIYENSELFKKYYYIIDNNYNVVDYRYKLLRLFVAIVDNKDLLDEYTLLKPLERLKIEIDADIYSLGLAGLFDDSNKLIKLLEDYDWNTYHELLHYLDFNFNFKRQDVIYICDNKISNIYNDNCREVYIINSINSIVEAGAEVYSARYFRNNFEMTYPTAVELYNMLEYVLGYDAMKNVFFSNDSTYQLCLLLNNYLDADEVLDFIDNLTNIESLSVTYERSKRIKCMDYLTKIYNKTKKNSWTDDRLFVASLGDFVSSSSLYSSDETPNYELYNKTVNINSLDIFNDLGLNNYSLSSSGLKVMVDPNDSNKVYLLFECYYYKDLFNTDDYQLVFLKVEYDLINNKYINYEHIEK